MRTVRELYELRVWRILYARRKLVLVNQRSWRKDSSVRTESQKVAQVEQSNGRPLQVFGELLTRKVASEQTGGAYSLFEAVTQPHAHVPAHIHHREDECFYILKGDYVFQIEGHEVHAPTGTVCYVPKGTLHGHQNISQRQGSMLAWQTPGGLSEQFYEEVGEDATDEEVPPIDAQAPQAVTIVRTAAHYGIEILPPHALSPKGPK